MIPNNVAIVAEWLTSRGGAEEVVKTLLEIYPDADLYTSLFNPKVFTEYIEKHPKSSFLQRIPVLNKRHQSLAPFLPLGMHFLNVSGHDLIISSSSSVGKFIRRPKGSVHICYCHTPMRYAWEPEIDDRIVKLPMGKTFIEYLKKWDLASNRGVDHFLCNSNYTKERIKKYYNREATVIYPPVEITKPLEIKKEDYYICLSRLIPYKKIDLAIEAANALGKTLYVCGSGPEMDKLKSLAGKTIKFLGRVDDEEKIELLAKAKGLIFPSDEDFGIVPIEAMSQGTPVIVFGKGGVLESVQNGVHGVYFNEQTAASIVEAIAEFEKLNFDRAEIIKNAEKFSKDRFVKEIKSFIEKL